jgi:hypothetical protein
MIEIMNLINSDQYEEAIQNLEVVFLRFPKFVGEDG